MNKNTFFDLLIALFISTTFDINFAFIGKYVEFSEYRGSKQEPLYYCINPIVILLTSYCEEKIIIRRSFEGICIVSFFLCTKK